MPSVTAWAVLLVTDEPCAGVDPEAVGDVERRFERRDLLVVAGQPQDGQRIET
jgi:ABC-type lipopolysaccharide export system ATPase subunit